MRPVRYRVFAGPRTATGRRRQSTPGIGSWTADVVALRAPGDHDAFPSGDLVLRRVPGVPAAREVAEAGLLRRPWRAFAATHLWVSVTVAPDPAG